ncbi:hypothetical protein [Sphingobacterium multivorum]
MATISEWEALCFVPTSYFLRIINRFRTDAEQSLTSLRTGKYWSGTGQ